MDKNSPLDFLFLENFDHASLFGDNDTNEVFLPEEGIEGIEPSKEELGETPAEESLETSKEPRDIISELLRKISDLKEEITDKLKPLYPEDKDKTKSEALDDATSALDLCQHHLEDIDNDVSGEEHGLEAEPSSEPALPEAEPTMPLEDGTNV